MSKNLRLRHDIINQLIEDIAIGVLKSPLPSQTDLANFYNVSRTTIRSVLQYLIQFNIIKFNNNQIDIVRVPDDEDKISNISFAKNRPYNLKRLENYFQNAIQQKRIKPNDVFSELELAKNADVDVYTVREYLMKFARFNLLTNISRGKWKLTEFSPHYADKLFELRAILECHALRCFMKLPANDVRWDEMKILSHEHQNLKQEIIENYANFSHLDHKLHTLILSAADNPFIDEFIELITVIFHFHYQWNNQNLRTRNILAVEEHLTLLNNIINKDEDSAMVALKKHLRTAKSTLIHNATGITPSSII